MFFSLLVSSGAALLITGGHTDLNINWIGGTDLRCEATKNYSFEAANNLSTNHDLFVQSKVYAWSDFQLKGERLQKLLVVKLVVALS